MDTLSRNFDIASGCNDLALFTSIPRFPVYMGTTTQSQHLDKWSDLNIHISLSTGMIQINPILPLETVYGQSHGSGTTGSGWINHHKALAEYIVYSGGTTVFEIGGGGGRLARIALQLNNDLRWTTVEPNPGEHDTHSNITVIPQFFTGSNQIPPSVDTIVHSHLLEHIHRPCDFMRLFADLPVGTRMIFSVPYLEEHLRRKYTNVLNFEHTYLCDSTYIKWLCESWGWKIVGHQVWNNDHSVFWSTVKTGSYRMLLYPDCVARNTALMNDWLNYHTALIDRLNVAIDNSSEPVYLFGAHAFSQYLISFGLSTEKIISVLDNDKRKHNQRLYGTKLMVRDPQILRDLKSPLVILRTGVFNEEIKNDILRNVNSSTIFLE